MFKVLITYRAISDLEKIDKKNQEVIIFKIKEYSSNPFKYAVKVSDPRIGNYRFRIGKKFTKADNF